MSDAILVVGATGNVGRPLVQALVATGATVKAGSRGGQPVEGAPGVVLDLGKPDTFANAFDGVTRMYLLSPGATLDARDSLLPALGEAQARGVKVVLQTAMGVEADDSIPYRQVELTLERSGLPFVILRPNWFSDNFHTYWKAGLAHGVIAVPAADGASSFVDVRDIADSAVTALLTDRFDGQAFTLTGPTAHTYADAAAVLTNVVGRPIAYTPVDDDTFVAQLVAASVPEAYARFLASIFYPVRQGWTAAVTDAVQTLAGHAPRSLETYARDNAALLRG